VAIFGVVLSAGVSAVAVWLAWERRRLRRRVVEVAARHEVLEVRLAAEVAHHEELVAAMERDLSVAATVANWRAFHDDLTALPNRALLIDRLEQSLARRSGREGAVVVLACDLDRFRVVNESVGRSAGDALLVQVADRLSATVRPGDTVARIGGDEFVVVADGLFGEGEATELAERIRLALAEPFAVRQGQPVTLSVSIGIVVALEGSPEGALRDADTALARAKDRGRNRVEFFTRTLRTESVSRLGLEYLLRHALKADGVDVHYQPIVDLASAATVGGEALLRIRTHDGRLLFPDEFLGVAEETGLIGPLGAVLMEQACRQFEQWRVGHPDLQRISVNMGGRELTEPGVLDGITRAVEAAGLEPHHLCIDITETALVESGPATREALDRLTGSGFGLGIDDFGTGYGSLAFARSLPADTIKIDRYLVAGLTTSPEDRALVTAAVELANSMGVATVAEGVETEEQLEVLRLLGCTYGQGYFFSRPVEAAEFGSLLDRSLIPISGTDVPSPTMQEAVSSL
jgi:diguanylate cyclase (GGDEF)-like protein